MGVARVLGQMAALLGSWSRRDDNQDSHELGHYFLGNGHPQKPGDFLYGGIMDYHHPVSDADRQQYRNAYLVPSRDIP